MEQSIEMSEPSDEIGSKGPRSGGWISLWFTAVLAISAAITLGYWAFRAIGEEDTEALESPLMLSVARQLVAGPGELYGPFGGRNPLVLIHAPLYYRAAGLSAWPMVRVGLHPITAARVAGRSLSALGLLATLAAGHYMGRLGGGSRRAGCWAVLLIAASPVLAGQPLAVRPDMVGVALQTTGVALVLSALEGAGNPGRRVVWGYAAFGLAACVKQNLVAAAVVTTALLLAGGRGGPIRIGNVARGLAVCAGIVACVYGLEWVMTAGRIWEAAFLAARGVGRIHPGGWDHLLIVLLGILNRTIALLVLLATAGLLAVGASRGVGRSLILVAGLVVIAPIFVALALHSIWFTLGLGVVIAFAACALAILILPICAIIEWSSFLGNRTDATLWAYLLVELAVAAVFFYLSTGSWMNYAIQAVVFADVLVARSVSRVVRLRMPGRLAWPAAVVTLSVPFCAFDHIFDAEMHRRGERAAARKIFAHKDLPPSVFFFAERPGFNRIAGRTDLVYDDWLYPVFESLHLAENRSGWLSLSLRSRSVRAVVSTSPSSSIEGTSVDLRLLGFHPDISVGPFYIWSR